MIYSRISNWIVAASEIIACNGGRLGYICTKLRLHHKVIVLGPPNVGRSTLLQLLGELEKLTFLAPSSGQNLEIPDLEAVIYMVDASKIDKLSKLSSRGVHLAILCNKKDLCSVDEASNIVKDYVIPPF